MKNIKYWHLALVISTIGIIALTINIRLGIGTSLDSVSYITAARNLLHGQGLQDIHSHPQDVNLHIQKTKMAPMTHFPPLYPTILALIGILGIDPLLGSELLALITFGINLFLVYFITYRYTKSYWLSLLSSFFALSSIDMLRIHSHALTEPLFITFILLTIFSLANYLEKNLKIFLYLSAIMASLAWLDRYIGITLVVASILSLWLFKKCNLKIKIIDSVIFIIISCLPISLWMTRSILIANSATNRKIFFHPITTEKIKNGIFTIINWIGTDSEIANITIGLIILSLFIFIFYYGTKLRLTYKLNSNLKTFLYINLIFIGVYIIFLFVSISLFDAATPLNWRILTPIFPLILMIILFLIYIVSQPFYKQKNIIIMAIVSVTCLFFIIIYSYNSFYFIKQNATKGIIGMSHPAWQNSIIIKTIKQLPNNTIIYTNKANTLFWFTNRLSLLIPAKIDVFNLTTNQQYYTQMSEVRERITSDTIFINFKTGTEVTEQELIDVLPLQLIQKDQFGAIYKMKH